MNDTESTRKKLRRLEHLYCELQREVKRLKSAREELNKVRRGEETREEVYSLSVGEAVGRYRLLRPTSSEREREQSSIKGESL